MTDLLQYTSSHEYANVFIMLQVELDLLFMKRRNASIDYHSYYIALAIDRTEDRLIVILLMGQYTR